MTVGGLPMTPWPWGWNTVHPPARGDQNMSEILWFWSPRAPRLSGMVSKKMMACLAFRPKPGLSVDTSLTGIVCQHLRRIKWMQKKLWVHQFFWAFQLLSTNFKRCVARLWGQPQISTRKEENATGNPQDTIPRWPTNTRTKNGKNGFLTSRGKPIWFFPSVPLQ